MLRSLVGSEMCIRDRVKVVTVITPSLTARLLSVRLLRAVQSIHVFRVGNFLSPFGELPNYSLQIVKTTYTCRSPVCWSYSTHPTLFPHTSCLSHRSRRNDTAERRNAGSSRFQNQRRAEVVRLLSTRAGEWSSQGSRRPRGRVFPRSRTRLVSKPSGCWTEQTVAR